LGRGSTYRNDGSKAYWKGIYDDTAPDGSDGFQFRRGRFLEWADSPRYPEKYSALGIRIGVNYVVYSLTH